MKEKQRTIHDSLRLSVRVSNNERKQHDLGGLASSDTSLGCYSQVSKHKEYFRESIKIIYIVNVYQFFSFLKSVNI